MINAVKLYSINNCVNCIHINNMHILPNATSKFNPSLSEICSRFTCIRHYNVVVGYFDAIIALLVRPGLTLTQNKFSSTPLNRFQLRN